MNYKNYFNRNKVIDNSYTCLHFTDKMKIEINPINILDDGKVIDIDYCNSFCNYSELYSNLNICITKLTGAQKISQKRI